MVTQDNVSETWTLQMIGAVAINAEDDLIFVGPLVLLKYLSTNRKH